MTGGLEFGKVVDVHPGAAAVDVLLLRNGQQLPMVQCMSPLAGTDCGVSGFAAPTINDPQNKWTPKQTKVRDIYCVVGFVSGRPVVLGFVFPQIAHMLFKDMNQRISRDASDVYTVTDDNGNYELYHPSGTYFRIGTDPAHVDLTGRDLDAQWKIARNTDKAVHVHLELWNGGAKKASIDIDPSGNMEADVEGTAKVYSKGDATYKSDTKVTIDAPAAFVTGTLDVQGAVSLHNGITDVGVNIGSTHVHGGVQTGGGNTLVPH